MLVAGAAILALVHAGSFLGAGPHDDDFIVYRYARNLVEGHGLVFQPGERIEGYSAPLWVLIQAGGIALSLDPVVVSLALGITAAAIATWAIGDAWRARFPEDRWPVPALLLAATPALAWHAVVGLGTTLLAALLALWLRAHEREERAGSSKYVSGAWLAAACLLRQECVLLAIPWAIAARRKHAGAALLPFVALGGWTVFRLAYYGRWLPISYAVKKLAFADDLSYGLAYLWNSTLECGVGVYLVLALFLLRGRSAARALALGLLAHAAFTVYVGGDYLPLARFFVPVLPLLAFAGSLAARELTITRRETRLALTLAALLALQWTQRERAQLFGEQRFFVERWAALGRHFGKVFPSDARVAISPIGAFGYTSRLPLVDILGLTNDRVRRATPDLSIAMKGHHRYDAQYVLEQQPTAIVLFNGVFQPQTQRWEVNPWERTLYEHPRFQAEYVAAFTPIEGSDPLLFYLRRGAPVPEGAGLVAR
jgi:hypothetical protein